METWWHVIRSGVWKLSYLLPAKVSKRLFVEFFPMLHDVMVEVLGERATECYYLSYIGTKPNSRKKGYAGRTIRYMMEKVSQCKVKQERQFRRTGLTIGFLPGRQREEANVSRIQLRQKRCVLC